MTKSEQSEQTVREYFESRVGWKVTKLDSARNNGRAADFRICEGSICFLCEVKTVESVRANFPSTPLYSYLEQRGKQQAEIKKWTNENPDKRLILRPGEWDFIHGDEFEFEKKYRKQRRNTEDGFKKFAQTMKDHLSNSIIKDLPYSLRLDSDDLYVPNLTEQSTFFKWLENEIQAINKRNPSRDWCIQKLPYGNAVSYSTFYSIHAPTDKDDVKAKYQLMIKGPYNADSLEVNIHSYGGLNLDAITSNVKSGLDQLEKSASREQDHLLPRIIVLAFASGIGFDWQALSSHIVWLLENHSKLSAIAILDWIPDGIPPSPEQGFFAWARFRATTPIVPRFEVYHNSWLDGVKPLPIDVFNDKWSAQLPPVK